MEDLIAIVAFFFTQTPQWEPSHKIMKKALIKQGAILDVEELSKKGEQIISQGKMKRKVNEIRNFAFGKGTLFKACCGYDREFENSHS